MKNLSYKNILIGSLQPWFSPLVNPHYLTLELSRLQNQITFLEARRIGKLFSPRGAQSATRFHNLAPKTLTLRRFYVSPRISGTRLLKSLGLTIVRRILGKSYDPQIIISFDPVFDVVQETYPNALKIYYCADYLSANRVMADAEKRLLSACDIVIAASGRLFDELRMKHSCVRYVPHGVDLLPQYEDEKLEAHIAKLFAPFNNRPIFGFLGHISQNVDFDLIRYLARQNANCIVALVGLQAANVSRKVESLPRNVVCPGYVPSVGIKYCLKHFDVGLVPYIRSEYVLRSHPIKIMQYVAAGLPVVSTTVGEDFTGNGFVYQCGSYEEFSEMVRVAHEENCPESAERRVRYAKQHSWRSRVEEIDRIIEQGNVQ